MTGSCTERGWNTPDLRLLASENSSRHTGQRSMWCRTCAKCCAYTVSRHVQCVEARKQGVITVASKKEQCSKSFNPCLRSHRSILLIVCEFVNLSTKLLSRFTTCVPSYNNTAPRSKRSLSLERKSRGNWKKSNISINEHRSERCSLQSAKVSSKEV